MTDVPDRLRAAAMVLPETEERTVDGVPTFLVAGEAFVRLGAAGGSVEVRSDAGWQSIDLADPDWATIEDRVARGWELTAPRRLLEAGGR